MRRGNSGQLGNVAMHVRGMKSFQCWLIKAGFTEAMIFELSLKRKKIFQAQADMEHRR
jgi:endonuclease YncB( thermonuclease family)